MSEQVPQKAPLPEPEDLQAIFKRISEDFQEVTPIISLARRLNVEPGQLILMILFMAFGLTIFGAGTLIVNILVGMLYPGFMSVQAIKLKDNARARMWLSYWIIFLSMFVVDRLVWLLIHDLQSLYYPVKTMFMIWLYYPKTRGALIVMKYITTNLVSLGLVSRQKTD